MELKGKSFICFGDSIVDGHLLKKAAFPEFLAKQEGMVLLENYANNGACILPVEPVDENGLGGMILRDQVEIAATHDRHPDFIIFNGSTNDCYEPVLSMLGDVESSGEDTRVFAGAFRKTIHKMQEYWPEAKIVYLAVHKLYARDMEIQKKLHAIKMAICKECGVTVANMFEDSPLDVTRDEMRMKYSFDVLVDGVPAPGGAVTGTHPNYLAVEEFFVPFLKDVLEKL